MKVKEACSHSHSCKARESLNICLRRRCMPLTMHTFLLCFVIPLFPIVRGLQRPVCCKVQWPRLLSGMCTFPRALRPPLIRVCRLVPFLQCLLRHGTFPSTLGFLVLTLCLLCSRQNATFGTKGVSVTCAGESSTPPRRPEKVPTQVMDAVVGTYINVEHPLDQKNASEHRIEIIPGPEDSVVWRTTDRECRNYGLRFMNNYPDLYYMQRSKLCKETAGTYAQFNQFGAVDYVKSSFDEDHMYSTKFLDAFAQLLAGYYEDEQGVRFHITRNHASGWEDYMTMSWDVHNSASVRLRPGKQGGASTVDLRNQKCDIRKSNDGSVTGLNCVLGGPYTTYTKVLDACHVSFPVGDVARCSLNRWIGTRIHRPICSFILGFLHEVEF